VYSDELGQVSKLFTARRARVDAATSGGVPPILIQSLAVLVALILVSIPFIEPLKDARSFVFYGAFSVFLIASIFFIIDLNNPFAGTVSI
jgi:hypothetical protein